MIKQEFSSKHPGYEYLRKKWILKHRNATADFLQKHSNVVRQVALGGLGGLVMATVPAHPYSLVDDLELSGVTITKGEDTNSLLVKALEGHVPEEVRKLTLQEEVEITDILSKNFNIGVRSNIDNISLNRSFGVIGGEQHLYRYPGDSLFKHAGSAADWVMYGPSGIAPKLGAWGYFTPSLAEFTEEDKMKERYYIAVQTYLAPGFAENVGKYRDFFKYRKMLVVNPATGQSVVAVVGDAGPAEWTGKHLGGSPEVMHYLGFATGPRKGPVLYFFVDDSENIVPLGPISVKKLKIES